MSQFPEMDDPELQELLELEAAERGEAGFVAAHAGSEELTLAEVAEVDPELADLMAMVEEDQLRQPAPPTEPKPHRWRKGH